ncbi:uncharacterized protein [Miscanthus floridulus]|uniref:uncharacterized protein n=1 Tax=Miscanthus floridulus TaxID=154761 RepID=UPI00345B0C50
MRPSQGFLSLKRRKDAKVAKRTKHILTHEELDKRRHQQRKDGLPLEESPSTSLSTEALDGNDKGEGGRGPLDHLPDIVEVAPEVSASSPAPPGGGGEVDPGPAVARSGAEADTPEARALGKRAVSPVGSAVVVEQVVVEATPPPLQRTEGAPGSTEDRPAPMDTEATPLPPPPPLQMRLIFLSRKRPADNLPLAPLKALKASPSSSAHWVAEAQAAIHCGTASARVDLKEPATQGGAAEVAPTPTTEGSLPSYGGEAHELDGAGVPLVAEAPGVSKAEAMEDRAPKATETTVAAAGVSASSEAMMVEAGAPKITKAVVVVVGPSVQEAEMKAAEASVAPLAQGLPLLRESAREAEVYPISSDDTSWAREVVNAEDAGAVE